MQVISEVANDAVRFDNLQDSPKPKPSMEQVRTVGELYTHTHTHTHAHTHTRTHTYKDTYERKNSHTHPWTHTNKHTHTHTHTHVRTNTHTYERTHARTDTHERSRTRAYGLKVYPCTCNWHSYMGCWCWCYMKYLCDGRERPCTSLHELDGDIGHKLCCTIPAQPKDETHGWACARSK